MIFRTMDYGRPVRNAVYAFRETFWRKQFVWKVRIVWIVSEYERNLIAGLLKLPSKRPVERFDEKPIFGKTSYFWWGIHSLWKTFLTFYERNWQGCQNSILRLRWNMLRKSGLLGKVLRFSLNLDSEQKKYKADVLNLCSRCPEHFLDENFCFFEARPSCFLFGLRVIILRSGCRTSFLDVEGNTTKQNYLFKRPSFSFDLP